YTGQYGRQAGAQVNYVTKSGTNQWHGSAKYWYNDVSMNATDWFLNNTNTKPGFAVNNHYAASMGGPIVNVKVFFVVRTERVRYRLATSTQIFVPTQQSQTPTLANLAGTNPVPSY